MPSTVIPLTHNLSSKSGYKWSLVSSEQRNTRTQAKNIVHIVQGPANNPKNVDEPLDYFSLL